jgi:hypothetical protein
VLFQVLTAVNIKIDNLLGYNTDVSEMLLPP